MSWSKSTHGEWCGRRGVVEVVCGMWLTWRVVDVAWSMGVVMNAHIPQHEGRGKEAVGT